MLIRTIATVPYRSLTVIISTMDFNQQYYSVSLPADVEDAFRSSSREIVRAWRIDTPLKLNPSLKFIVSNLNPKRYYDFGVFLKQTNKFHLERAPDRTWQETKKPCSVRRANCEVRLPGGRKLGKEWMEEMVNFEDIELVYHSLRNKTLLQVNLTTGRRYLPVVNIYEAADEKEDLLKVKEIDFECAAFYFLLPQQMSGGVGDYKKRKTPKQSRVLQPMKSQQIHNVQLEQHAQQIQRMQQFQHVLQYQELLHIQKSYQLQDDQNMFLMNSFPLLGTVQPNMTVYQADQGLEMNANRVEDGENRMNFRNIGANFE